MNTQKKLAGLALVTAAATLLLSGCGGETASKAAGEEKSASAGAEVAKVKCSGINSCKGTSACATATSACSGQNSCKGQGWVYVPSKEECDTKGGSIL